MEAATLSGVVRNGRIVTARPVDLPDGSEVVILPIHRPSRAQKLAALERLRSHALRGIDVPAEALATEELYADHP
jgi:hypothetical protein